MKLAESLLLRADMKKKLASLRERIAAGAVVQQGEQPHEDPQVLVQEAAGVLDQLERLTIAVNTVNITHRIADGRTLMQLIARRDNLVQYHAMLQHAIAATKKEPDRYSVREIKWVATLDVAKLQKQADDLSKQIRELNGSIQETNWHVEVDLK